MGNRTDGGRTYNAANEVVGFTYDDAGNLLNDGSTSYAYDALGRLTQQGGTSYTYNGDGVLVGRGSTSYTQDLVAPLEQVLNDGTANLVYGLTRIKSGNSTWYQHDGVGSVRAVLDNAGAVQSTTNYDPWGVPTAGSTDPFGFTGELHDGDLVHLRARWYNPSIGTFTARDPFAGFDTQPYSLHPYQYAYSNPVLLTDPSGRVVPDEPGPPIATWDAFQNRYGYFDLRATPEDWERLGYTPQDATRYAFAYERYLQNPRAFIAQHPPGTWSYADAQIFAEHFLRRYFQAPVEMAVEEELLAFFDRVGTDPWTAEDRQCYLDLAIPFGFFNYEPMYGPFGKGGGGGGAPLLSKYIQWPNGGTPSAKGIRLSSDAQGVKNTLQEDGITVALTEVDGITYVTTNGGPVYRNKDTPQRLQQIASSKENWEYIPASVKREDHAETHLYRELTKKGKDVKTIGISNSKGPCVPCQQELSGKVDELVYPRPQQP